MNQEKRMVAQIYYGAVRKVNQFIYRNLEQYKWDISEESFNITVKLLPLLFDF